MDDSRLVWDMMRVRYEGKTVPRHAAGRLRAVRGVLRISPKASRSLKRHTVIAEFECLPPTQTNDPPAPLEDVHIIFCDQTRMVLTGVEAVEGFLENDQCRFGQTWVLHLCEGPEPVGTRGPPLPE